MVDNNRKRMTYEQQRALKQRNAQMSGALPPEGTSATRRESVRRSARVTAGSRAADDSPRSSRTTSSRASQRSSARTSARSSERTSTRSSSRTRADGVGSRGTTRRAARTQSLQGDAATQRPIPIMKIAVIAGLVIAAIIVLRLVSSLMPITVNINGTDYQLRGEKTLQTAAKESGLPLNPGDLISLQGTVLSRNEGKQFTAVVNGEKAEDLNMRLHDGDKVNLSDGEDVVEPYEVVEETIPRTARVLGVGALHVINNLGSDGVKEIRTGTISGDVVEKQTVAPDELTCQRYNPDVGNDKVIALTFDDGPSDQYTAQVLDILAENDAKATFFVVGTNVELGNNVELVQRAAAEGHQICSHTYDHARAGGSTNIANVPAEGQIEEVVKGRQVITDALGVEASKVVRLPGGNMDDKVLMNLYPYFEAEIGWNVDTADWLEPGADAITDVILQAGAGDIILMHDGGGNRSQTVEALRTALPELKKRGYTFVTIDEMLKYPSQ